MKSKKKQKAVLGTTKDASQQATLSSSSSSSSSSSTAGITGASQLASRFLVKEEASDSQGPLSSSSRSSSSSVTGTLSTTQLPPALRASMSFYQPTQLRITVDDKKHIGILEISQPIKTDFTPLEEVRKKLNKALRQGNYGECLNQASTIETNFLAHVSKTLMIDRNKVPFLIGLGRYGEAADILLKEANSTRDKISKLQPLYGASICFINNGEPLKAKEILSSILGTTNKRNCVKPQDIVEKIQLCEQLMGQHNSNTVSSSTASMSSSSDTLSNTISSSAPSISSSSSTSSGTVSFSSNASILSSSATLSNTVSSSASSISSSSATLSSAVNPSSTPTPAKKAMVGSQRSAFRSYSNQTRLASTADKNSSSTVGLSSSSSADKSSSSTTDSPPNSYWRNKVLATTPPPLERVPSR